MDNDEEAQSYEQDAESKQQYANGLGITSAVSSIYGGAKKIGSFVVPQTPELWPNMEKIDDMVQTVTIAGYSLISFGLIGSVYFALKTTRELSQWKTWLNYRKFRKR